jgi:hypothetical protein
MKFRNPRQHHDGHLGFIRGLPCLVCLDNTATEAAHIRMTDLRAAKKNPGLGAKPHDWWTVPLCNRCHREQHEMSESEFWDTKMIDPIFVAMALWINTGDHESGEIIIRAQH